MRIPGKAKIQTIRSKTKPIDRHALKYIFIHKQTRSNSRPAAEDLPHQPLLPLLSGNKLSSSPWPGLCKEMQILSPGLSSSLLANPVGSSTEEGAQSPRRGLEIPARPSLLS